MEATWAYYSPISYETRTMIGTDTGKISSGSSTREDTAASSRRAATSPEWDRTNALHLAHLGGLWREREISSKIDNPDYVRVDFISWFKRCHSTRTDGPPDLIARGAPIWRFSPVPFLSLFFFFAQCTPLTDVKKAYTQKSSMQRITSDDRTIVTFFTRYFIVEIVLQKVDNLL